MAQAEQLPTAALDPPTSLLRADGEEAGPRVPSSSPPQPWPPVGTRMSSHWSGEESEKAVPGPCSLPSVVVFKPHLLTMWAWRGSLFTGTQDPMAGSTVATRKEMLHYLAPLTAADRCQWYICEPV